MSDWDALIKQSCKPFIYGNQHHDDVTVTSVGEEMIQHNCSNVAVL